MNLSVLKFKASKLWKQYKTHGAGYAFTFVIEKLKKKLRNRNIVAQFHRKTLLTSQQMEAIKQEIEAFELKPLISVIMPVYNVEAEWLTKAIESVQNQLYPYWELCIADDASTQSHIKPLLEAYAATDSRIKVVFREESGNISKASNSALALASGEYMALLDNDDELALNALYENAKLINNHPEADWIYSDEDKIDEKTNHFNYDFKPDWSPELLFAYMYTCHLTVYRTQLVKKVGGFRSEFDGSQDYDLALRIASLTQHIYHIPKVLYHWRTVSQSTALNPLAKVYAYEAGKKAVENALAEQQLKATAKMAEGFGVYHTIGSLNNFPLVSIIIPSAGKRTILRGKDVCLLENCIQFIQQISTYSNIEIVVVDGEDVSADVKNRLIQKGVKWVSCNQEFNFSMRINLGVEASSGEYILMLNDDTETTEPNWIEQLLWYAQQKDIGAVGVKLITEAKRIQHVGIVLFEGSPEHICYGQPDVGQGYLNTFVANRNYLAVTAACLLVERKKYNEVDGLDETFPVNYNDVDFCLKLHKQGYRNVLVAQIQLYHYESISRTIGYKTNELERFVSKWEQYEPAMNDPYYNPNLSANPSFLF